MVIHSESLAYLNVFTTRDEADYRPIVQAGMLHQEMTGACSSSKKALVDTQELKRHPTQGT